MMLHVLIQATVCVSMKLIGWLMTELLQKYKTLTQNYKVVKENVKHQGHLNDACLWKGLDLSNNVYEYEVNRLTNEKGLQPRTIAYTPGLIHQSIGFWKIRLKTVFVVKLMEVQYSLRANKNLIIIAESVYPFLLKIYVWYFLWSTCTWAHIISTVMSFPRMLDFYKDGKHYRVAGVTVYNMVLLRYGNCLQQIKTFCDRRFPCIFGNWHPFFSRNIW